MHEIEPYYKWRDDYIAAEDEFSPFYATQYSEFEFDKQIYNYLLHPQWDSFGSNTLYMKVLFVDYERSYCIIEFIGEWNALPRSVKHMGKYVELVLKELKDRITGSGRMVAMNVHSYHPASSWLSC